MTVLQVVQDASLRIGIERPTVLFASTDRTMFEVQEAINAAAQQILDDYDWQALTKTATITGDAVTTAFPLPDDYYRMTRKTEMWSSAGPGWRLEGVTPEDFLALDASTLNVWLGYWAIFGNAMNIEPVRPIGETAKYLYINKNCVTPAAGAAKAEFTADDDTFVLNERLLKLCFIAKWKQAKGFDYAADQNDYEIALNYAMARDKGTRIIRSGTGLRGPGIGVAWPWELG